MVAGEDPEDIEWGQGEEVRTFREGPSHLVRGRGQSRMYSENLSDAELASTSRNGVLL